MMIQVTIIYSLVLLVVHAQFQLAPKTEKCIYTFVTESAICRNAVLLQEISTEFRPIWKHIRVVDTPGYFSIAGNIS